MDNMTAVISTAPPALSSTSGAWHATYQVTSSTNPCPILHQWFFGLCSTSSFSTTTTNTTCPALHQWCLPYLANSFRQWI
ncbi:unnamed protein product [Gadus morhua 'NCC']